MMSILKLDKIISSCKKKKAWPNLLNEKVQAN